MLPPDLTVAIGEPSDDLEILEVGLPAVLRTTVA